MSLNGIDFLIVKEGEKTPDEVFQREDVHTVIRYCPELNSISIARRKDDPPEIRTITDPISFHEIKTLCFEWELKLCYKGISISSILIPVKSAFDESSE